MNDSTTKKDQREIDALTAVFFNVFTNTGNTSPKVNDLKKIFTKEGLIVNNTTGTPIVYDLDRFIAPREKMLTDGTLTDFQEQEISQRTDIYNTIAQRFCHYKKSGKLNGNYFESEGMKTLQFLKINQTWKIISVIWSDTV